MGRNQIIRMRLAAALVAYLGFSPLFLLPGAYLLPENLPMVHFLPIPSIAAALAISFLPGKHRKWGLLAAMGMEAAAGFYVLCPINPLALLLLLPMLLLLFMFVREMAGAASEIWSPNYLIIGVILHIVGQLLARIELLSAVRGELSVLFSCYLIACLFLVNRYALMTSMGTRGGLPSKLLGQNRRAISWMIGLALVLGNLQAFGRLLEAVYVAIRDAAVWLFNFVLGLFPISTTQGNEPGRQADEGMGALEVAEPSAFWQVMEKIAMALAILVGTALVAWMLYILFMRVKRLVMHLLERLRAYSRAIGEDYSDQSESLFSFDKSIENIREKWRQRPKRRPKPPAWERLNPREKVRTAYALWKRGKQDIAPSLTAREALKDEALAGIYEKARYSEEPVSQEEAEKMRKDTALQK